MTAEPVYIVNFHTGMMQLKKPEHKFKIIGSFLNWTAEVECVGIGKATMGPYWLKRNAEKALVIMRGYLQ